MCRHSLPITFVYIPSIDVVMNIFIFNVAFEIDVHVML